MLIFGSIYLNTSFILNSYELSLPRANYIYIMLLFAETVFYYRFF